MKKILILFFCFLFMLISAMSGAISKSSSNSMILMNGDNDFIFKIVELHYAVRDKYDVLTSVTVAQAIEESGWGKSNIAVQSNNLFGIKGKYNGNSYIDSQGKEWRKYENWDQSVEDHARLLCNSNYNCAGVKDYKEIFERLIAGNYCEGNTYTSRLEKIIKGYQLTQYDNLTDEQFLQIKNKTYVSIGGNYQNYEPQGDSELGNAIVKSALSKCGCSYVWGASGPNTFDCSGLVYWACKQNGVNFGRTTASELSTMGISVSIEELQPGDILTFKTEPPKISHVGIYIGDGKMVHAPHTGDVVKVVNVMDSKYWRKVIHNCRRLY